MLVATNIRTFFMTSPIAARPVYCPACNIPEIEDDVFAVWLHAKLSNLPKPSNAPSWVGFISAETPLNRLYSRYVSRVAQAAIAQPSLSMVFLSHKVEGKFRAPPFVFHEGKWVSLVHGYHVESDRCAREWLLSLFAAMIGDKNLKIEAFTSMSTQDLERIVRMALLDFDDVYYLPELPHVRIPDTWFVSGTLQSMDITQVRDFFVTNLKKYGLSEAQLAGKSFIEMSALLEEKSAE